METSQSQPKFDLIEVTSEQFCDGILHCSENHEDELHPMCANRFWCAASGRISIAAAQLCDGIIDCDNGSDETNDTCTDRFFCSALGGDKVGILVVSNIGEDSPSSYY